MDRLPEQWECTFIPGLNCDTPEEQTDSGDESSGESMDDDSSEEGAMTSEDDEDYDDEHVGT